MEWTNAEITSVFIGIEDHGIFAWDITFQGPGWGQSLGARGLCAESLPTLTAIAKTFGPLTQLKGKIVRIGKDKGRGRILAIRDVLDDNKEVVL